MATKSVIITCAITGSLHTPSMSPYLPITPAHIAKESIASANAGASIIHLHARRPNDGCPTADPAIFMEFLPEIKSSTDAILNISTGGAPGMEMDDRLAAAEHASPEMTSLNMGSLNGGLFPALDRIKEFKYDWEPKFLSASKSTVFDNSFAVIETIMERIGKGQGSRFEFECYDVGHLYNLAHFIDRKAYEPPLFLQFIVGVLGGVGAELDNLLFMIRTAEKLFGDAFEFSVLAAGRHQMPIATHNALLGGNVRVGLEDNLTIAPKTLAKSNVEQVEKIRRILEELHYTIATPTETRKRLALKGANAVNF